MKGIKKGDKIKIIKSVCSNVTHSVGKIYPVGFNDEKLDDGIFFIDMPNKITKDKTYPFPLYQDEEGIYWERVRSKKRFG